MTIPADWLDQLKAAYPKRAGGQGWAKVAKLVPKLIEDGHSWETILQGVRNYRTLCSREQKLHTPYVLQARTFFGPDLWFEEYAELDVRTPAQKREDAEREALTMRAQALGHKEVDWSRGTEAVRLAVELAESKRLRIVK